MDQELNRLEITVFGLKQEDLVAFSCDPSLIGAAKAHNVMIRFKNPASEEEDVIGQIRVD